MENFWSLLKRMLGGTYVSVDPFHLFRKRPVKLLITHKLSAQGETDFDIC
jgi:hypothetical protein